MQSPSRELACDWCEIIGLLSWSPGMGCSGTLAEVSGMVLGRSMQRVRMSPAGGAVAIRNSTGALGEGVGGEVGHQLF